MITTEFSSLYHRNMFYSSFQQFFDVFSVLCILGTVEIKDLFEIVINK